MRRRLDLGFSVVLLGVLFAGSGLFHILIGLKPGQQPPPAPLVPPLASLALPAPPAPSAAASSLASTDWNLARSVAATSSSVSHSAAALRGSE